MILEQGVPFQDIQGYCDQSSFDFDDPISVADHKFCIKAPLLSLDHAFFPFQQLVCLLFWPFQVNIDLNVPVVFHIVLL